MWRRSVWLSIWGYFARTILRKCKQLYELNTRLLSVQYKRVESENLDYLGPWGFSCIILWWTVQFYVYWSNNFFLNFTVSLVRKFWGLGPLEDLFIYFFNQESIAIHYIFEHGVINMKTLERSLGEKQAQWSWQCQIGWRWVNVVSGP